MAAIESIYKTLFESGSVTQWSIDQKRATNRNYESRYRFVCIHRRFGSLSAPGELRQDRQYGPIASDAKGRREWSSSSDFFMVLTLYGVRWFRDTETTSSVMMKSTTRVALPDARRAAKAGPPVRTSFATETVARELSSTWLTLTASVPPSIPTSPAPTAKRTPLTSNCSLAVDTWDTKSPESCWPRLSLKSSATNNPNWSAWATSAATAAMAAAMAVTAKRSRAMDNPLATRPRGPDPQSKATPRDTKCNTNASNWKAMVGTVALLHRCHYRTLTYLILQIM